MISPHFLRSALKCIKFRLKAQLVIKNLMSFRCEVVCQLLTPFVEKCAISGSIKERMILYNIAVTGGYTSWEPVRATQTRCSTPPRPNQPTLLSCDSTRGMKHLVKIRSHTLPLAALIKSQIGYAKCMYSK